MQNETQPNQGGKPGARPGPVNESGKPGARLAVAPTTRGTPAPAPAVKVPPLFRTVDWITFALTTLIVLAGYLYTISPDLTLEDSGELAVASYYAGVPHPPGYPLWTIITWLFTELVPISNIAFRVSLLSALSGALASGMVGLMVSRGSSMMIESIGTMGGLDRKWENIFCLVAGYVAAMLTGFNGFMWSQCVIVEVYPLSVFSLTLMLCMLMRWMYAPHQNRYLYLAFFLFGVCFSNHQTLILAAMGLEVAIIAAKPRMGRDLMLGNSLIFLGVLILKAKGLMPSLDSLPGGPINMVFAIFLMVGISSLLAYAWLTFKTEMYYFWRDGLLLAIIIALTLLYAERHVAVSLRNQALIGTMIFLLFGSVVGLLLQLWNKRDQFRELGPVTLGGIVFAIGVAFYLFMPITSMSNPPLNWGYPRTEEGFMHAFTRGQYEKTNPTNIFVAPGRFVRQMWDYTCGLADESTLVYLAFAVIPFLFLFRMQKRERAWMIGLTGIFICLSALLMIMLNPNTDRQSLSLNRVFFAASHMLVAMWIGYGIALAGALLKTDYQRYRVPLLIGAAVAVGVSLYGVVVVYGKTVGEVADVESIFYALLPEASKSALIRFTALFCLGLASVGTIILAVFRTKAPLALLAGVCMLMPIKSVLAHWADNEQRGHFYGYWFGHDMFTPPFKNEQGQWSYDPAERQKMMAKSKMVYPEMDRDTVLFGGTDPGRFCPTYMIFCESFIPPSKKPRDPNFDRRDVYLITQNALADGTYLNYIRAHYNRSAQIDPPFFQEVFRSNEESARNYETNWLAKLVSPLDTVFEGLGDRIEKGRRAGTSFFQPDHFTDLPGLANKLRSGGQPQALSRWLWDNLSAETKSLAAAPNDAFRKALAADLNKLLESGLIYDTNRFAGVPLLPTTQSFIAQNPKSHTRIRLNRLLLEEAYPKEIAKSIGGVYPDREIITPTPEDSQKCFSEYLDDVQKRMQNNQLRPGEDVRVVGGKVQVTGQVAVMAINALLTKVIFDKNPDHEFYVEESFPLQWMYPYLTPYGIIMKINRQPLNDLTEEILQRDHQFWSEYSERLVGNWITYDTSVADICRFVEDVYVHKDMSKFKGEPTFIRDDNAQKAFSKLRSSIGGVYAWRLAQNNDTPPQYRPKTMEQRARVMKEAEFAFKQAFAFCPYSPEAVFRYINLLLSSNQPERINDALLIAKTCRQLDPGNGQVEDLINKLEEIRKSNAPILAAQSQVGGLETAFRANPTVTSAFSLAQIYMSMQRTNEALRVLNTALAQPQLDSGALVQLAGAFVQLGQVPQLEQTLLRLTKVTPDNPEAFFDLAGVQAIMGRQSNALVSLKKALQLNSSRIEKDPKARNLKDDVYKDGRFNGLRTNPDFIEMMK
jgi:tetratricopeptide (TPR) repeat protein